MKKLSIVDCHVPTGGSRPRLGSEARQTQANSVGHTMKMRLVRFSLPLRWAWGCPVVRGGFLEEGVTKLGFAGWIGV